jgi:hypothetical protein
VNHIATSWIDLHMHSTASDGELETPALMALLARSGVKVAALTDHDSVAGLASARLAGEEHGVQLINGVELSSRWDAYDIHVVGLNINPLDATFAGHLEQQMTRRRKRAEIIAARLEKLGFPPLYEAAAAAAPQGIPARPHFARALVAAGICRQERDAFAKYLAQGKPAYVKTDWPGVDEAVAWIRAAGGVAVLAHPHRYKMTRTRLTSLIRFFAESGGQALEVVSANQDPSSVGQLAQLASQFQLYASMGSDYHGPSMRWVLPGRMPVLPSRCQPVWSLLGIEEPRS